ncbi:DeoR/GlpR transcriptional regulator [Enterococcus saccharolyticus]|uniref:DeoR family transcriptional regulator n=1 Tax=Candidatus Enterococcus willemsii TaxID=1857215 RepID=A0ABQ6Z2T2_9ENTE|nr:MULTISPECIES: DeoR/GlpR family DNA-binding transcription regulator [Enterococcus]KAF1306046.1 DeoR family transcriptional regulator [Enterococcus sp. CU12B]MCD5003202.1 DeoR/GlpR transcriptional regulator [Enterococcus saccharolyticus]
MLTEERHQQILTRVEENDIVTINELLQPLEASESTIRRDLQSLEKKGLLTRIHGGAKKKQRLNFEASMDEKEQQFHAEKLAIAKVAAEIIEPEDVIYLDAGSTTIEMIPFIPIHASIKVVTNSVKHASLLIDRGIDTIILGGTIKLSTNAVLGHFALQQLRQFRFNKAFMGMNGAHFEAGYTTPDPEEAVIKELAMSQSQIAFVLLDRSKLQQTTFTQVAPLEAANIITNTLPTELAKKFLVHTKITEVQS